MLSRRTSLVVCICLLVLFLLISAFILFDSLNVKQTLSIDNEIALEKMSIQEYEKQYCNELMEYKTECAYYATLFLELYDFTKVSNYILCYDENCNWYAIINRNSGDVSERANSESSHANYSDKECFYLGYGNYYYLADNHISSTNDNVALFNINDIPDNFVDSSIQLNQSFINNGTFNSKDEIESFIFEQNSKIYTLCNASNRSKTSYCDNLLYFLMLSDAFVPNRVVLSFYDGTSIQKDTIGCGTFTRYSGLLYDDIIFPINFDGTCGIVSAAMLLQYFERLRILNTVSNSFYSSANTSFVVVDGWTYIGGVENIVAQKLYNAINSYHNEVFSGSTYVSIKDAINGYFSAYGITGISASSSVLDTNAKKTIDNGDPVIVFIGSGTGYNAYVHSDNYHTDYISAHAMLAFGYTKGLFVAVDEYICNKGWDEEYDNIYTYGVTYISRVAVAGNVRILH